MEYGLFPLGRIQDRSSYGDGSFGYHIVPMLVCLYQTARALLTLLDTRNRRVLQVTIAPRTLTRYVEASFPNDG